MTWENNSYVPKPHERKEELDRLADNRRRDETNQRQQDERDRHNRSREDNPSTTDLTASHSAASSSTTAYSSGPSGSDTFFLPLVLMPFAIIGFIGYSTWVSAVKNFQYFYAWEFLDIPTRWVVGYYNWMFFDASVFLLNFAKSIGNGGLILLAAGGLVLLVVLVAVLKVAPAKYSVLFVTLLLGPLVSLWLWWGIEALSPALAYSGRDLVIKHSYVTKSVYPDDLRFTVDRFQNFLSCNDEEIKYNAPEELQKLETYAPFKFRQVRSKFAPKALQSWAVNGPLPFRGLQVKELSIVEKDGKNYIFAILNGNINGLPQYKRHQGSLLAGNYKHEWDYQSISKDEVSIACAYRSR